MENENEQTKCIKQNIINWAKNVLDTEDFTIDEYSHIVHFIKELQASTATKSIFKKEEED